MKSRSRLHHWTVDAKKFSLLLKNFIAGCINFFTTRNLLTRSTPLLHRPAIFICNFNSSSSMFVYVSDCAYFYFQPFVKMFQTGLVDKMNSMVFHQPFVTQ